MEHQQSYKIFSALSDKSRLMIINSLLKKPQYVEEISERMDLSVSTVSFHLKKLLEANLIYKVKEQYYTIIHLNPEMFDFSLKELISFSNKQILRQEERLKDYSEKVLRTYTKEGRIFRLPAQYKKRKILLEAILTTFEKEKVYPEKELDHMINRVYDDHCSVRRSFIDEKMMFRKRGKYTVNEKYMYDSHFPDNHLKFFEPPALSMNNSKKETKMDKRSEIKKQYKQSTRPMGVYQLKDLKNNKIYIGSSKNLDGIFNRHNFELTTGMHQIKEVQETWNNYKDEGIVLQVLDKLEPKEDPAFDYSEELKLLEKLWLEKLGSEGLEIILLNGTSIKKIIS